MGKKNIDEVLKQSTKEVIEQGANVIKKFVNEAIDITIETKGDIKLSEFREVVNESGEIFLINIANQIDESG